MVLQYLQQTEFLPIYVVRKFVISTVVVEIGKSDP
jgi:hypothetical protein